MVFGLFSRKSIDGSALSETRTNDQSNRPPTPSSSLHFATALGGSTADSTLEGSRGGNNDSSAPPPPDTPTPPPSETKALYDLMLAIPPKTLHAYTLAHLRPPLPASAPSPLAVHSNNAPRPPSPDTVNKLISFFSTLAPPPLLHCVRCHKDFYDVENEERACRVAHDDESALVSRVSGGGGGYETLWGCCGQVASGDGSEGPPDGWCYEGKHTTDIRRARFRADSTTHNDKLTSCLKLNCHGIRDRLPRRDSSPRNVGASSARRSNPSPVRSQASRSTRKRPRTLKETSGSENGGGAESVVGRAAKANHKEKDRIGSGAGEDTSMTVDGPAPSSKPRVKAKSRPIPQVRPPASTSSAVSLPTFKAPVSKARTTKPKSTSRTLLSQSYTHLASDSEASTRSRPRTRSHVRDESHARDAPRNRTPSKLTRASISERTRRTRKAAKRASHSLSSGEAGTDEYRESEEGRGRDRKKRRVGTK